MAIGWLVLQAPVEAPRLLTGDPEALVGTVRSAFSDQSIHEHAMWLCDDALHAVVETVGGDLGDVDDAVGVIVEQLGGENWSFIVRQGPADEDLPVDLRGEALSIAIVRMALEGEGSPCDVCQRPAVPPHGRGCPLAKRDGGKEIPDQELEGLPSRGEALTKDDDARQDDVVRELSMQD